MIPESRRDPYRDVARLLLPPDHGTIVGAEEGGLVEVARMGRAAVWVDVPTQARRSARLEAERAHDRLRARRLVDFPRSRVSVHRLPAGGPARPVGRALGRRVLRDGRLVAFTGAAPGERVVDQVLRSAQVWPTKPPRFGAGGCLLQFGHREGVGPVALRIGLPESPGDPRRAAEALRRLAGTPEVPSPVCVEVNASEHAAWTVERCLPGRAPRRLDDDLLGVVAAALARLPASAEDASGAARRDLAAIACRLPHHAELLEQVQPAIAAQLARGPAVFAHGDLWTGNLLAVGGHWTGVVDWGTWVEDAATGTDVLQLVATAWRRHLREPLGTVWMRAPWEHPRCWGALAACGAPGGPSASDRAFREALGVAWWAREIAGTLERYPTRAEDADWVACNIGQVTARLGGSAESAVPVAGGAVTS